MEGLNLLQYAAVNETLTREDKDVIADCRESMESFDVSMACISRAVYNFPLVGKEVADWSLEVETSDENAVGDLPGLGTDKMNIYKNGQGTCVLAISGSDDANDWITDFTFAAKPACNLQMHSGFYNELHRLTEKNPKWPTLKTYLQTKCQKTWFVGHSLGGALVSALAACVVAGTEKALEGLPFDGLYTFGAPGISTTPATNKDGGCFPGKRVYNLDLAGGDPVPAITDAVGLKHPKIAAVRLWDKWFGGVVREELKCDEEATYSIPHFGIVPMPAKHLPSWYINREKDSA